MIGELLLGPSNSDDEGRGGAKDGSGWSFDGWVRWLEGLRGNYERRMNRMSEILEEGTTIVKSGRRNSLNALSREIRATKLTDHRNDQKHDQDNEDEWTVIQHTPVYNFVRPMGGMFFWLRFDFSSHPLAKPKDKSQTVALPRLALSLWIFWTTKPYLVLISPGTIFAPTPEIAQRDAWTCFRLSFAAIDENQLDAVCKRFVNGVRDFWRIKEKKVIDELLKDVDEDIDEVGEEMTTMRMINPGSDSGLALLTGLC
jgi:hypothetical protein